MLYYRLKSAHSFFLGYIVLISPLPFLILHRLSLRYLLQQRSRPSRGARRFLMLHYCQGSGSVPIILRSLLVYLPFRYMFVAKSRSI
jgi:hypothetical protein